MSDANEAVQWLNATGTLDQIAREVLAPAIAAALNENAYAAGYAAGVKDERDKLIALRERAFANLNDIEAQLAAIRARSDAQEVKP